MTDIRDLKPLIDAFPWEIIALGFFSFLLATAALWRFSRRPQASPLTKNRRSRSIRQRLDLLKHKNLTPSQLCEALGDLMRDHLRSHYGIPCHRLTTEEIIGALYQKEAAEGIIDPLRRLFEACDLVKFAKWQPRAAEIEPHLTSADWVLENTKESPA